LLLRLEKLKVALFGGSLQRHGFERIYLDFGHRCPRQHENTCSIDVQKRADV